MTAIKPSRNEEEYFARQEAEKKRRLADEIKTKFKDEELTQLRNKHHGHCSKCGMEVQTLIFKDIQIDKCYACGAVVLGEEDFEKLAGEEDDSLLGGLIGLFK